jgi:hypothetical protein
MSCPQTRLNDDDLRARYEEMWRSYEKEVSETSQAMTAAYAKKLDDAMAQGDLELAMKWKSALKWFNDGESGSLNIDRLREEWPKKNGDKPFPDDWYAFLGKCDTRYRSAKDRLFKGYEALTVSLTQRNSLSEARVVANELLAFELGNPLSASWLGLHGRVSYDEGTRILEVRYSAPWREDVRKDFEGGFVSADVDRDGLLIKADQILTHVVCFDEVTVEGRVSLPRQQKSKVPECVVSTSSIPNVTARYFQSVDKCSLKIGEESFALTESENERSPKPKRSGLTPSFCLKIEGGQAHFYKDGASCTHPCPPNKVGTLSFSGGPQGCTWLWLTIRGRITKEFAADRMP